jgi:hypothetical protein
MQESRAQGIENILELLLRDLHALFARLVRWNDGDVLDVATVEADAALFVLGAALIADHEARRFRARTSQSAGARRRASRFVGSAEEEREIALTLHLVRGSLKANLELQFPQAERRQRNVVGRNQAGLRRTCFGCRSHGPR